AQVCSAAIKPARHQAHRASAGKADFASFLIFLFYFEFRTMSRNTDLFERACKTIPGGVNSSVRAFRSVGGSPRFIKRALGPYVWDVEDVRYIDYVGSWGPAILGHAHPDVIRVVQEAAVNGLSFGAPTEGEIEIAEAIA